MSETNTITAEMYGIKVTGLPSQIAELKKLLDEQNPIKVKFIPQTQPVPFWEFKYPLPYTYTYKTTTGTPQWNDLTVTCNGLSTSNDMNCVASNGSLVQNLHLTN